MTRRSAGEAYVQPIAVTLDETLGGMGDEAETSRYSCAFCGGDTADDPRWVRIGLSWDYSEAHQQLGAHFACLQAALKPGFPLYDGLE